MMAENHTIQKYTGHPFLVESNTDFRALYHTLGMWFILRVCLVIIIEKTRVLLPPLLMFWYG